MGKARDACGLVFRALVERIRSGAYKPGGYIAIGDLAVEFRTSATPVREALARLTGEGLVEEARGRGYVFLSFDASHLSELYTLHHAQLIWAAERLKPTTRSRRLVMTVRELRAAGRTDPACVTFLFQALIEAAGNRVLGRQHSTMLGRLGAPRRVEAGLLGLDQDHAESLAELIDAADITRVRLWLNEYARLRLNMIDDIAVRLAAQM